MADIINYYSDIAQAFIDGKRIRTMNHRGSILNTTVAGPANWAKEDNSYLYLTMIPFTASLKSMQVAFKERIKELTYNIGIAGINSDNSFTVITENLFDTTNKAEIPAGTPTEIIKPFYWGKTLYELLNISEEDSVEKIFPKYACNRYGMLFLKQVTPELTNNPQTTYVNMDYVEGAPSESPLTQQTVKL